MDHLSGSFSIHSILCGKCSIILSECNHHYICEHDSMNLAVYFQNVFCWQFSNSGASCCFIWPSSSGFISYYLLILVIPRQPFAMNDNDALKQVFKDTLTRLNDQFPEQFAQMNLYKNVARLERKTTEFVDKFTQEKLDVCSYCIEFSKFKRHFVIVNFREISRCFASGRKVG